MPQPHRTQRIRALSRAAALALLAAPLLASAPSAAIDTTPPQFTSTPVLHGGPVRACPLVATITFTTDEPARAELGFRTQEGQWTVPAERTYQTSHTTLVMGMRPDTLHEIRLRILDLAGNETEWPIRFYFHTPKLPVSFPPLNVTVNQTAQMEPGLTLVPAQFTTMGASGAFVILLDGEGKVVWFWATRARLRDVSRLRNGNFLCLDNNFQAAMEVDPLGQVVQRWWASNLGTAGAQAGATFVPVDTIHHEFSEMPPGYDSDFIGLSSSHRTYPNYPTNESDTTQTEPVGHVAGSVIFEMKRDGTVLRECDLLDVLDPYRICYNALAPVFGQLYGQPLRDWGHANSVVVDPSDDTWVVSVRHQEAVVKIRRSDNSLVWIHGPPDRWTLPWSAKLLQPIGSPFEWHFHQHAAQIDALGRMTMFDNGNYRVVPPAPATPSSTWYSRAVAYQVDPFTGTTQQVWAWDGGGQGLFSGSLGAAYPLPQTGNVLLTEGNKIVPGMNKSFARIQEVSTTTPSVKRFEVIVNDPTLPAPSPYSWVCYRARRVSGIYPHL